MESLESIVERLRAVSADWEISIVPNEAVSSQSSMLIGSRHVVAVARFLKEDPSLRMDYLSSVTGVDWLDATLKQKQKVKKVVEGAEVEVEVEEPVEVFRAGYLEAVYHLYSISLKQGPLVFRVRTEDRKERVRIPSLTPVWRSAEFQEREIFDLYGIVFEGHPDLRRLLMWEGFKDHPMRKDYLPPDDFEYEPTPHDEVLERARQHYPEAPRP